MRHKTTAQPIHMAVLFKNKMFVRSMQALLVSLCSPAGWALIQLISGVNLLEDIANNKGVYIYMTIGTAAAFTAFGVHVGNQERKLSLLALMDPLTGLYNKRYFQGRLREAYFHSKRTEQPLSLIMLDLDHFKKINDTYGHLMGDQVLQGVADALKSACRGGETVARVGGEELCILLTNSDQAHAAQAAERFRHEISQLFFFGDGAQPVTVTASAGVASTDHINSGYQDLYAAADTAMYRAKEEGRDRVCVAEYSRPHASDS